MSSRSSVYWWIQERKEEYQEDDDDDDEEEEEEDNSGNSNKYDNNDNILASDGEYLGESTKKILKSPTSKHHHRSRTSTRTRTSKRTRTSTRMRTRTLSLSSADGVVDCGNYFVTSNNENNNNTNNDTMCAVTNPSTTTTMMRRRNFLLFGMLLSTCVMTTVSLKKYQQTILAGVKTSSSLDQHRRLQKKSTRKRFLEENLTTDDNNTSSGDGGGGDDDHFGDLPTVTIMVPPDGDLVNGTIVNTEANATDSNITIADNNNTMVSVNSTTTTDDSNFTGTPEDTDDSNNSCGCQYGDGTFCGTDGQCHLYDCESFYEFGPVGYTGYYDSNASPELVCNDIWTTPVETAGDSSQASVVYRCRDLVPEPIGMGWTKYCEASSSNSNFTCYGLVDTTDFNLFLQQAETSQLECNSGEYDETGYPAYTYSVSMYKQEGNHGTYINTVGFNATQEFDETKALTGTMTTTFEAWTDEPTQSPISMPTYSPVYSPTDSSSTGKSFFVARFILLIGLIGFL